MYIGTIQIGKNNWDLETYNKSLKYYRFIVQFCLIQSFSSQIAQGWLPTASYLLFGFFKNHFADTSFALSKINQQPACMK